MYCQLCGDKLEIHDLPPRPKIDWELEGDELEKSIEANANYPERLECTCSNGCFGKDYPLYYHHPLGGIDTAPGDSWSLSWVK